MNYTQKKINKHFIQYFNLVHCVIILVKKIILEYLQSTYIS